MGSRKCGTGQEVKGFLIQGSQTAAFWEHLLKYGVNQVFFNFAEFGKTLLPHECPTGEVGSQEGEGSSQLPSSCWVPTAGICFLLLG